MQGDERQVKKSPPPAPPSQMPNAPLALVFWVSTWEVSHALKKHTTVIAIVDLLGTPLAAPALDSPTVHDARKMVVNAARPTLRPPPPHGGAPLRHTRPLLLSL